MVSASPIASLPPAPGSLSACARAPVPPHPLLVRPRLPGFGVIARGARADRRARVGASWVVGAWPVTPRGPGRPTAAVGRQVYDSRCVVRAEELREAIPAELARQAVTERPCMLGGIMSKDVLLATARATTWRTELRSWTC